AAAAKLLGSPFSPKRRQVVSGQQRLAAAGAEILDRMNVVRSRAGAAGQRSVHLSRFGEFSLDRFDVARRPIVSRTVPNVQRTDGGAIGTIVVPGAAPTCEVPNSG